jgi:hypothetical protein
MGRNGRPGPGPSPPRPLPWNLGPRRAPFLFLRRGPERIWTPLMLPRSLWQLPRPVRGPSFSSRNVVALEDQFAFGPCYCTYTGYIHRREYTEPEVLWWAADRLPAGVWTAPTRALPSRRTRPSILFPSGLLLLTETTTTAATSHVISPISAGFTLALPSGDGLVGWFAVVWLDVMDWAVCLLASCLVRILVRDAVPAPACNVVYTHPGRSRPRLSR